MRNSQGNNGIREVLWVGIPTDAAIALGLAASGSASCDPAALDTADVSGDGRFTSLGALMILQAAASTIELG